jgi:hypothetical protein
MIIIPLSQKDDTFHTKDWSFFTPNPNPPPQLMSNTTAAGVSSNGDELTIGNGSSISRSTFNVINNGTSTFYVRARNPIPPPNGPAVNLTATLNQATTFQASLQTNVYTLYRYSLPAGGNWTTVSLSSSGGTAIVDFIAFNNINPYIDNYGNALPRTLDIGGTELDVKVDMKTVPKRIPMATDVIQQIGISSRTHEIKTPKVTRNIYNAIEIWVENNIPVMLFMTPISGFPQGSSFNQAFGDTTILSTGANVTTGYITNVEARTEAGWLSNSLTYPVLYDVNFSFIKGDSIAP